MEITMFNMHRKLTGEAPMVYRDPVTATLIATGVGAGVQLHGIEEQKKAAKEAQKRTDAAAAEAEEEAARIASDTRPVGETAAEGIQFGAPDDEDEGSFADFLQPTPTTSGLGTAGTSGLGFAV